MKLFAPFFTLSAYACYSKPRQQKPCIWNIGNWKLGTTSGSQIGNCPWLPCTELGNKTERENCVSKRPGSKYTELLQHQSTKFFKMEIVDQ